MDDGSGGNIMVLYDTYVNPKTNNRESELDHTVGKYRLLAPVRRPSPSSRTCPMHCSSPRRCGLRVPFGRKSRDAAADLCGGATKKEGHRAKTPDAPQDRSRASRTDRRTRTTHPAATRTDPPQTLRSVQDIAPHRLNRISVPMKTRDETSA